MIPRPRTCVDDAAPQNTFPHPWSTELRSQQETPGKNGKKNGAYPKQRGNVNENHHHVTWKMGTGRKRVEGKHDFSCRRRYVYGFAGSDTDISSWDLPMIHVIVVTHFLGCVEIEIIALFLSWHQGDWTWGSLPCPETPCFPSNIHFPSNTNTIPTTCAQVITGLWRIIEAVRLQKPENVVLWMQPKLSMCVLWHAEMIDTRLITWFVVYQE